MPVEGDNEKYSNLFALSTLGGSKFGGSKYHKEESETLGVLKMLGLHRTVKKLFY